MMLLKMITIILIAKCAADNQKLQSEPEVAKERAKRLSRRVISAMNYKYTKNEQYSSPTSIMEPHRAVFSSVFQKLQYAPLHDLVKQKNKHNAAEYTTASATPSIDPVEPTDPSLEIKSRLSFGKSHLEPREVVPDKKCYSPDLTSVSRSPGLNAVYRKITKPIQNETPSKINDNVRPSGVNLNMELLDTTFSPLIEVPKLDDLPLDLTSHHYIIHPVKPAAPEQGKTKRQYAPLTKYHRLHLNIARVYSPGQVHGPKPPSISNSYSGNFDGVGLPAYSDLSQDTVLYPVKNQELGYHYT